MLKINEIFYSIQGESSYSGYPSVFIRTSGCHLRCSYCDTQYAYHDGSKQSIDSIVESVDSYGAQYVCVTGGEPLLQPKIYSLMTRLCNKAYKVSLETSGDLDCKDVDSRVKKIIDIKTPDSGATKLFNEKNLKLNEINTEFKFIICSQNDFYWAENFILKHPKLLNKSVFYSPSYKVIKETWLAEQMIQHKSKARLQIQLHKFLWPSNLKGV